jgi:hypothetical protein
MIMTKKKRINRNKILHFCLGYRDYQSLFLVGQNLCDGSRVVSNILRIPSRKILFHRIELVVESFLVMDSLTLVALGFNSSSPSTPPLVL